MKLLIDADPLVYQVGFAGEERWYELTWWPDGVEKQAWFYNRDRLDQFMTMFAISPDEVEISLEREAEPLQYVLSTLKRKLKNVFAAIDGFLAETDHEADEYQLYLTDGASNFRNNIATIAPYKGNRDPTHKPIYYHEIREYMVDHWGAIIMRGCEADDALSIAQHKQDDLFDSIICTIDKDLKMVPGLHYNYGTKEEFYVSERDALLAFYTQLLTGDTTDNIKGCYRAGKVLASNVIEDVLSLGAHKSNLNDLEDELYEAVLAEYQASIDKHGAETKYAHMGAQAAVLENARLLWMQQYPGQLWTPPGQPDQVLDMGDN